MSGIARGGRSRTAVGWGLLVAGGLVVALASVMGPSPEDVSGLPGARLALQLPDVVVVLVLALFGLATLLMLALLVPWDRRRHKKSEEEFEFYRENPKLSPWAWLLLGIAMLLPLATVAYVVWLNWWPAAVHQAVEGTTPPELKSPLAAPPPKLAVLAPFFSGAVGVLLLLAGLGSLGLMLWILFGDRLAWWWAGPLPDDDAEALKEAVEESLDDLRDEPDARVAIVKCYRRFEQALAASHVGRAPWQTPVEFMRTALRRLRLPRDSVERLTHLFEIARFSNRPVGLSDRDAAWEALETIKTTLNGSKARVENS